jgi:hypothetical protein
MIKTGYILFIAEPGGEFQDADGNTVLIPKVSSEWIECNLNVMRKEYKMFVDGQYKQVKYACYVDLSKLRSLTFELTDIHEIQLKDLMEIDLGQYQIQSLEYLNLAKSIKILVSDD